MAAPTVAARATSESNSASTSHTITLPSGISSGDLLLVFMGTGNNDTSNFTFPSGWTEQRVANQTLGASPTLAFAYREADGTEGSNITVTSVASCRHASVALRVTGAAAIADQTPESQSALGQNSVNPDPPSLTPTGYGGGGPIDYLYVASMASSHGSAAAVSAYPSGYSNGTNITNGSSQSTRVSTATAEKETTSSSSDDPGTFTHGGSAAEEWGAITVAVYPPESGGTTYNENDLAVDIVATTSVAHTAVRDENSLALDVVSSVAVADTATFQEVLADSLTATVSVVDGRSLDEPVNIDLVATVSQADQAVRSDSLSIPLTAGVSLSDVAVRAEALALDLVMDVSVVDVLDTGGTTYEENDLTVSLVATVSVADQAVRVEAPTVNLVSAVSVADAKLMPEALSFAVTSTVTGLDGLVLAEALTVPITTSLSVADVVAMVETLAVDSTATVSVSDLQTSFEALALDIDALVSVTDFYTPGTPPEATPAAGFAGGREGRYDRANVHSEKSGRVKQRMG